MFKVIFQHYMPWPFATKAFTDKNFLLNELAHLRKKESTCMSKFFSRCKYILKCIKYLPRLPKYGLV